MIRVTAFRWVPPAAQGVVRGFRPAGYYPIAIAIGKNAHHVFVLNTKGNGSVRNTIKGLPGNAHDFQGTVSSVDLTVTPPWAWSGPAPSISTEE